MKNTWLLIDLRFLYAFDLSGESFRDGEAEPYTQRIGAQRRAVIELHARYVSYARLSLYLQTCNVVDERRMRPWFSDALRLPERDDVGGGFLDDGVAGDLQASNDRSFSASGSAGKDVSFHSLFLFWVSLHLGE